MLCQEGISGLKRATDQETLSAVRLDRWSMARLDVLNLREREVGMYGVEWAAWKKAILKIIQSGRTVEQTTSQSVRVCPEVLLDVCRPASGDFRNGHATPVPHFAEYQVCVTTLWRGEGRWESPIAANLTYYRKPF